MKLTIPKIVIERNQKTLIGPYFKHVVGSRDIKQKTIVQLSVRVEFLEIEFLCLDVIFVDDKTYNENKKL